MFCGIQKKPHDASGIHSKIQGHSVLWSVSLSVSSSSKMLESLAWKWCCKKCVVVSRQRYSILDRQEKFVVVFVSLEAQKYSNPPPPLSLSLTPCCERLSADTHSLGTGTEFPRPKTIFIFSLNFTNILPVGRLFPNNSIRHISFNCQVLLWKRTAKKWETDKYNEKRKREI